MKGDDFSLGPRDLKQREKKRKYYPTEMYVLPVIYTFYPACMFLAERQIVIDRECPSPVRPLIGWMLRSGRGL